MLTNTSWRNISGPIVMLLSLMPGISDAVDWGKVQEHQIVLFYPGQSSWEWILTQSDHSGAQEIREGKLCRECHEDEQSEIGEKIVSGKKLEAQPVSFQRAFIPVTVQVAHDATRFYVRLRWPESNKPVPANRGKAAQAMVTMILGDGKVVEFKRGGCWGACHDDLQGMPSANPGQKLTKYLIESRTKVTRQGGGTNYKSDAQLDALLEQGTFLEYWQARLNTDKKPVTYNGYVLAKRLQGKPSTRVRAEASRKNGYWTVVLSRNLTLGQAHHKDLVPGKTYTVGFAIHDNFASHRHHNVSFEYSLRLDEGPADLIAGSQ